MEEASGPCLPLLTYHRELLVSTLTSIQCLLDNLLLNGFFCQEDVEIVQRIPTKPDKVGACNLRQCRGSDLSAQIKTFSVSSRCVKSWSWCSVRGKRPASFSSTSFPKCVMRTETCSHGWRKSTSTREAVSLGWKWSTATPVSVLLAAEPHSASAMSTKILHKDERMKLALSFVLMGVSVKK